MERPFKYITVLDYENGQVYLYEWDRDQFPVAEDQVSTRHNLDNVHYMVHKWPPALWTKNLYYCSREDKIALMNCGDEDDL